MSSSLAQIGGRFFGQVMSDLFPSALDDVLQWVENQGWQIDPPEAYCPQVMSFLLPKLYVSMGAPQVFNV